MEENKKTARLKTYLITTAVLLFFVLLMLFTVEKPYEKETAADVVGSICNCFTVPGVLFAGVGGLTFVSSQGVFDGLGYAFSTFGLHNIWFNRSKLEERPKNYYEYKEKKNKKGRHWYPNLLFVGLGSLFIGVALTVVYLLM